MIFLFSIFLKGFIIALGLITSIGMQNSFVLKQGILKNHILLIVTLCSLIDTLFITTGIIGVSQIILANNIVYQLFNWGGIIFIFGFGIRAFYLSFTSHHLVLNNNLKLSFKKALISTLVVTFLNPHLYLDTCVLLGGLATNFSAQERFSFAIGAILASWVWFFSLGYASSLMAKFFKKPTSWRILDFLIGCTMMIIAFSLIRSSILK